MNEGYELDNLVYKREMERKREGGKSVSYHQTIYNLLRKAGCSEAGALGILGNWECESNCEPYRLQGDFSQYRNISKGYVSSIESGKLTRDAFAADQKGFGLAQWTYHTRKRELYDEWKKSGKKIDDPAFQVAFAVKEFKRDFYQDWELLKNTRDVYSACKWVCYGFENPAVKNVDARFAAAAKIKNEIDLDAWRTDPGDPVQNSGQDPVSLGWEKIPAAEYWPPRMICKDMSGKDVVVLRAILYARAWTDLVDDDWFDGQLEDIVKDFQEAYGLDKDGIVGPKTWAKLLERGES